MPALIGESDLLKSRDEFPTESPDLRRGLACFLLGPEPLIPLFGGLSLLTSKFEINNKADSKMMVKLWTTQK